MQMINKLDSLDTWADFIEDKYYGPGIPVKICEDVEDPVF